MKEIAEAAVDHPHGRIRALDAMRGFAMLFVCLSHFVEVYFTHNELSARLLWDITKFASPSFILVSGILLGYFYTTKRDSFAKIRENFLARGLFLLTIGHLIILVTHIPHAGGLRSAAHWGFITDAIGLFAIVGPYLVEHLGWIKRTLIAAGLIAGSWFIITIVEPRCGWSRFVVETIFGPHLSYDGRWYADNFPILPWLGLYLSGTVIGEVLFAGQSNKSLANRSKALAVIGGFGFIAGIGGGLAGRPMLSAYTSPYASVFSQNHSFLSPFRKLPPSPIFLLFYGSIGLLFLAIFFLAESKNAAGWLFQNFETVGRNSLFVFMFQYLVYFTIFPELRLEYTLLWPCIFLLSFLTVWVGAVAWDKRGWNRYLRLPIFSGGQS